MLASIWMSPCSVSGSSPSPLAVMVWLTAVMLPPTALGVPPVPPALPMPTIDAPTANLDEFPVTTVRSPEAFFSCSRAMSSEMEYPRTVAPYSRPRPSTCASMVEEFSIT